MNELNKENNVSEIEKSFYLDTIDETWNDFFFNFFGRDKLTELLSKVDLEWENNKCYPEKKDIFRLFKELPLEKIKVVIIGQDPYHQFGVADGIAFSTKKKNFIPASLRNIFLELNKDLEFNRKNESGDLINWVRQGVFLINTSLTVRDNNPLSHSEIWKEFVYFLLQYINSFDEKIIWVFWGREARMLKDKCNIKAELSIISAHPSPFSASYGFFGSKPFSKINENLELINKEKINW